MTFDEAVAELKSKGTPGIDGYVKRATASATYYAHYITRTDHPAPKRDAIDDVTTSIHDGLDKILAHLKGKKMKRTRDQLSPEYDENRTAGGKLREAKPPKGVLVLSLPGPLSAYYVGVLPDGSGAALYRYADVDDLADRYDTPTTAAMTKDARERDADRQAAQHIISGRIAAFWKDKANAA